MQKVAGIITKPQYPTLTPYNPSEVYPEYQFNGHIANQNNYVYKGVRDLFVLFGYDRIHYGTKMWNPLGEIIKPGMSVVIKPNFVLSQHYEGKDIYSIITHPSLIRVMIDYCWIALQGEGRIIVADAPQYNCNFDLLVNTTGLDSIIRFFSNNSDLRLELYDLRNFWSERGYLVSMMEALPGDPNGSISINLGNRSELYEKSHPEKLYGASYWRDETISHHTGNSHEYVISNTILNADVVISLPKLKVHKKVGVTLNAKGLVGIATNKNYLVHYTLTPPSQGGDQYPDNLLSPVEEKLIQFERVMYDLLLAHRKVYFEYIYRIISKIYKSIVKILNIDVPMEKRQLDRGNWHGNDSAWRMASDLLRIFYFSDGGGNLHKTIQRKTFSVIDGIIGGENNGPLLPDPKPSGILLAGEDILAVDLIATRIMGFDPLKLPLYRSVLNDKNFDFRNKYPEEIEFVTNVNNLTSPLENYTDQYLNFTPHPGWLGHIEINP
jgi:uncharacterized protein (DUF362 family)